MRLLLIILAGILLGSLQNNKPASDNRCKEDFQAFRIFLVKNYPSLYRYSSKEEMDGFLDSCENSIKPDLTEIQFYGLMKLAASRLRDGHTYVQATDEIYSYIEKEALLFPLQVRFVGNKVFVIDSSARVGYILTAINEVSIPEIRKRLFTYISADGFNESRKSEILGKNFAFYYWLAFGESRIFRCDVTKLDSSRSELVLNAVHKRDIKTLKPVIARQNKIIFGVDQGIGQVNIPTFDSSEIIKVNGSVFSHILKGIFRDIKERKVTNLIIDLGDNGGGRDLYGSLLYSYLADKPFRYYSSLVAATDSLPFEDLQSANSSFNLKPSLLRKTSYGYILKRKAHSNLGMLKPQSEHFDGKVFILTNGLTYSTAAELCACARIHKRAIFIGEETGGALDGNTSGAIVEFEMPYSHLKISIGTIAYTMHGSENFPKGRGVIPDYRVLPDLRETITGGDPAIGKAFELAGYVKPN
jgi:hypothetical protein